MNHDSAHPPRCTPKTLVPTNRSATNFVTLPSLTPSHGPSSSSGHSPHISGVVFRTGSWWRKGGIDGGIDSGGEGVGNIGEWGGAYYTDIYGWVVMS